jgi:hypothetical protein
MILILLLLTLYLRAVCLWSQLVGASARELSIQLVCAWLEIHFAAAMTKCASQHFGGMKNGFNSSVFMIVF